jgi:hypothetical protein
MIKKKNVKTPKGFVKICTFWQILSIYMMIYHEFHFHYGISNQMCAKVV